MRWPTFLAGALCGLVTPAAVTWLVHQDWRPIAAPLDRTPLVIRQDAKGDGRFGSARSGNRRHRGVDIEAPVGSAVRSIRSGRVVDIGMHRGLGRFIEVQHAHGLRSLYGHLQAAKVRVGERVRQGQAIATVGKTGNARNRLITSHLHLEVHRAGAPIDPATLGLALLEPATPLKQEAMSASGDGHEDGGE